MKKINKLNLFQSGILFFWASWFTIVSLSDFANFLVILHLLPQNFSFSSNNYELVVKYVQIHGIFSTALINILFMIIMCWAAFIAISFWVSMVNKNKLFIYYTFLNSLLMTAIFILSDEVFINYQLEHGHTLRIILQLLSYICFFKNIQGESTCIQR